MNWYSVFYWLTVADGVKGFFNVSSNIFTAVTVIAFIALVIVSIGKAVCVSESGLQTKEEEDKDADFRSWALAKRYISPIFFVALGLALLTWTGYVFTPSKRDCVVIVAGGTIGNFLSSDTNARKVPAKAFNLLNAYMDKTYAELTSEERAAMGVQTKEEKTKTDLVGKLKTMSKDQIIEWLQSDSAKVSK